MTCLQHMICFCIDFQSFKTTGNSQVKVSLLSTKSNFPSSFDFSFRFCFMVQSTSAYLKKNISNLWQEAALETKAGCRKKWATKWNKATPPPYWINGVSGKSLQDEACLLSTGLFRRRQSFIVIRVFWRRCWRASKVISTVAFKLSGIGFWYAIFCISLCMKILTYFRKKRFSRAEKKQFTFQCKLVTLAYY